MKYHIGISGNSLRTLLSVKIPITMFMDYITTTQEGFSITINH